MNYYRQCQMRRENEIRFGWIPEKYAQIGKVLDLKKGRRPENGGGFGDGPCMEEPDKRTWDKGWEVIEVGSRASDDEISELEINYKRTRKASDI